MSQMPLRVVVTGVNGFVGGHMAAELHAAGAEVIGIGSQDSSEHAGLADYIRQDLTQGWPHGLQVDAIVHLAGLSAVGPSFDNPQRYIEHNSSMVTHMCESLLEGGTKPRVLVVSSGAVYDARQKRPLGEDSALGFNSPYVVSKVLVENQAAYYVTRGLDVIVARPFNHIGPGQGPGFLVPDLCIEAEEAMRARRSMAVGNLESRRDYTDVRDVVRAYGLLARAGQLHHRVFNVCSGRSWSGWELLEQLQSVSSFPAVESHFDARRARPNDPDEIVGNSDRLRHAVGWRAELTISASVRDFLESK